MSRAERSKGARGELEVLELVRVHWPRATRNFASGAAGNGDIAHGPAGVILECKRTERLRIRDAWRQVTRDALLAGGATTPILATRWNGARFEPAPPWLAVLELEDVLDLLAFKELAL